MKIYFVRHAQGYHNLHCDYQLVDPQLTNEGIRQCHESKQLLQHVPYDKIYVSPLTRTIQTCYHIWNQPDNIEILELIREVVVNPCDYRDSKENLASTFPLLNFDAILEDTNYNHVETDKEVEDRCHKFFHLLQSLDYKTIHVITHGEFLNRFLHLYGNSLCIENKTWFENCEIRQGVLNE